MSDEAIICPSCGFLFKTIEFPKKEKVVKRKARIAKPKAVKRFVDWRLVFSLGVIVFVIIAYLFIRNNSVLFGIEVNPVRPQVIKKYSNDGRSSMLDARTTIYAVVKNSGGEGKAKVTFSVYQGAKSYHRDTIIFLGELEEQRLNVTFDEVRVIDGRQTFNVDVMAL